MFTMEYNICQHVGLKRLPIPITKEIGKDFTSDHGPGLYSDGKPTMYNLTIDNCTHISRPDIYY